MKEGSRWAREFLGAAVYSVAEGKRVGEVAGLFVDRARRSVAILAVASGTGSHPRYLSFAQIQKVGEDAVMIASEATLAPALSGGERRELENRLAGRRVLSQSGEHLGTITDYRLNIASGQIEGYQFQPESQGLLARLLALGRPEPFEIPDRLVITLGTDALVVPDDVASFIHSTAEQTSSSPE
jgi:uncharacterized protein YrrD